MPLYSPALRQQLRAARRRPTRTLRMNDFVPDDRIKVTVQQGFITLEGTAEWQYQKTAAEACIRYLTGKVILRGSLITVTP